MRTKPFSFSLLLLFCLCSIFVVKGFFVNPTTKTSITATKSLDLVQSFQNSQRMHTFVSPPNQNRRRVRAQQLSMLDDATIGGILAGVSGLSLGIGAMIFTEGQQERRRERQAQNRSNMFTNDTANIPTTMESSATITEDTPGSIPSSSTDGANSEKRPKEEVSDDGW